MTMAGDQPSPIRHFLRTWRREIIRGGMLFGLVVVVGLMVSRVRVGLSGLPWEALRSFSNFDFDPDGDLFGAGREIGDQWEYRGPVKASQQVWIRNTNGPIEVVQGTGDMLEVIAEKSWRHSNPSAVEIVAVPTARGVTICALWAARERRCADGGDYQLSRAHKTDVAVRFSVKLPRGVQLDVSTVNGGVAIDGAGAPVTAATVNGTIGVHTSVGPVKASTVNGRIEATMEALTGGDVELETVNGSVTAVLPAQLNAVLDAQTVNGRVETEIPLQMTGRISPRHVRGTIGSGGLTLKLNTVNGSIHIRQATPDGTTRVESRRTRQTVRVRQAPVAPVPPKP
ncbi:MAG TPA: DUF4097 family beta strand repeat-containing protein [Gemmatimonadales bacterium]